MLDNYYRTVYSSRTWMEIENTLNYTREYCGVNAEVMWQQYPSLFTTKNRMKFYQTLY